MNKTLQEHWLFAEAKAPRGVFKEALREELKVSFDRKKQSGHKLFSRWFTQVAMGFAFILVVGIVFLPGFYDRRQAVRLADSSTQVSADLAKNFEEQESELEELEALLLEVENFK